MIKKKYKVIMFLTLFVLTIFASGIVYATMPTDPGASTPTGQITTTMPKLWGIVITVVQLISIGCVVFAGVRYMFSAAGGRAEIKKSMIYLAIGACFIFGAVTIIRAVVDII